MDSYNPQTFFNTKIKKPWFVSVLSKKETRLKNGTVVIHMLQLMLYIFLPVIMPNLFFNLLKILSSIKKAKIFAILTLLVISGIQQILSPTILLLHLSLLYFNQMASRLSLLFLSSLKPSLPLFWMILGILLLLLHPLTYYFILKILILHYEVFHALSSLDFLKAYGPDGLPPVVLKNYASLRISIH